MSKYYVVVHKTCCFVQLTNYGIVHIFSEFESLYECACYLTRNSHDYTKFVTMDDAQCTINYFFSNDKKDFAIAEFNED